MLSGKHSIKNFAKTLSAVAVGNGSMAQYNKKSWNKSREKPTTHRSYAKSLRYWAQDRPNFPPSRKMTMAWWFHNSDNTTSWIICIGSQLLHMETRIFFFSEKKPATQKTWNRQNDASVRKNSWIHQLGTHY